MPRPHNVILVQFGQFALYAFSFLAMWVAASLLVDQRWLHWMTYSYLLFGGIAALVFVPPFLIDVAEAAVAPGAAYSPYWVWLTAMAGSQLLFNRRIGPWGKIGLIVHSGHFALSDPDQDRPWLGVRILADDCRHNCAVGNALSAARHSDCSQR